MRTSGNRTAVGLAAFVVWTAAATVAPAQFFIGSVDADRQLQPGAVIPHDGLPFSHRYGFFAGSGPSYSNFNQLEYLDYLDRLDRAERFGYRLPTPPAFLTCPRCRACEREAPPALFYPPIR
jgi:hypothetical protein